MLILVETVDTAARVICGASFLGSGSLARVTPPPSLKLSSCAHVRFLCVVGNHHGMAIYAAPKPPPKMFFHWGTEVTHSCERLRPSEW